TGDRCHGRLLLVDDASDRPRCRSCRPGRCAPCRASHAPCRAEVSGWGTPSIRLGMVARDGSRSSTSTAARLDRRSPPTERVVAVIDLLAAHPDRRFTLTEIITQLAITKATCFSLLRTRTRAGYLVRHPDKTYGLGPALVAVGRAAQKSFSPLDG